MATNRPEAALDPKQPPTQSNNSPVPGDSRNTTPASAPPGTHAGAFSKHYSPPPLRPPRGHAVNLVQPKSELQPPPAATAAAKTRNGVAAAAVVGGGVVGVPKSTCAKCTNISIMQLFYEMKQRFPTVSDDVVNGCVLDYCHQRERCLAALQVHSESNQTLIPQSYPSKSLRTPTEKMLAGGGGARRRPSQQQEQQQPTTTTTCDMNRQSNTNTIPRRSKGGGGVGAAIVSAAVPLVGMVNGRCVEGMSFRRQSDTNSPMALGTGTATTAIGGGGGTVGKPNDAPSDILCNGGRFLSNNLQRMAIGGSGAAAPAKVERPCTLNLSPAPHRPFRTAPPIPSTTSSTSSLSSLSTATDLASASSPQLTASNESINVSVNVTLSPILTARPTTGHVSKPPIPPRHTTELTVQPEMLPFATAMPTRSFTSVNFTLRPPADGASGGGGGGEWTSGGGGGGVSVPAATPIDITTAGSSMTYSSSSYNAKQGYQSQLQITVGNGGGSISAIRTKAPAPPVPTSTSAAVAASNLMRGTRNLLGTTQRLDADSEEVLINRQLQSKWKLSTELDKYRKRLDVMQRDVRTLQMPLPASAPDQLQDEIKRLQTVCDRMAAAVEEAGNFALGETNEAFYQRLDSRTGTSQAQSPLYPVQTTSTSVPGSPAVTTRATDRTTTMPTATEVISSSSSSNDNESETEGWTCSQCTFQNHPELNMCEQCGMVKRPPPPTQQQQQQNQMHRAHLQAQQQPQSNLPPPGIVQITSSQFIPALASNAAANQTPTHLAGGVMPTNNMSPYMMQGYHPHAQSPRMMYPSPMIQYPAPFSYPGGMAPSPMAGGQPGGGGCQSPMIMVQQQSSPTSPSPSSGSTRSSKGKKGSKFNSKFSQSISNLFSSSSSSSSAATSTSHANSQE